MPEIQVNKVRRVSRVTVGDEPVTVGRSSSNTLVLASNGVSRKHCVIEVVAGEPRVRDLGSRHGTKVNGTKVEEATLNVGDTIGVGAFELTFGGLEPDAANGRTMKTSEAPPPAAVHTGTSLASGVSTEADGKLRARLSEAHRTTALHLERAETLAGEVESLRAALDASGHDADRNVRELTTRVETLEADKSLLTKQLAERADTLKTAAEHAAGLEARLSKADDAYVAVTGRLDRAGRALGELEASSRDIIKAVEYLSLVLDGVRELEAQWFDVDERVQEANQTEGSVGPALSFHREQLAQQLEAVHEERDSAVAEVIEMIRHFRAGVEKEAPRPRPRPVAAQIGTPKPEGKRARRRFGIF